MAKHALNAEIQQIQKSEGLEHALMDLPAIQWIQENKKTLSYGFLTLLLLIVLLYRLFASQTDQEEKDYVASMQAASLIENPATVDNKRDNAIASLIQITEQNPGLKTKYDGLIGEQLLIQKKVNEANPFINRTFSRVQGDAAHFYIDFAKTSVLLAEGNTVEGLKQAYLLKDALNQQETVISGVLYAFNLLRIAFLEKQAGHPDLEKKAFNELRQLGAPGSKVQIKPQELTRVLSHFDYEGAKLDAFIQ